MLWSTIQRRNSGKGLVLRINNHYSRPSCKVNARPSSSATSPRPSLLSEVQATLPKQRRIRVSLLLQPGRCQPISRWVLTPNSSLSAQIAQIWQSEQLNKIQTWNLRWPTGLAPQKASFKDSWRRKIKQHWARISASSHFSLSSVLYLIAAKT